MQMGILLQISHGIIIGVNGTSGLASYWVLKGLTEPMGDTMNVMCPTVKEAEVSM